MPTIDHHPAGHFCWMELASTDQTAAKAFYTQLFGWTAFDAPIGPGAFYTMLRLNGRDAAALHTAEAGVPPHWGVYISVTNADESAAKAAALGGTLLAPPFDVMDNGRMAVIQDPAGAVFQIWQAKSHHGIGVSNEPSAYCWAELGTRDTAKAGDFYSGLLGWGRKASAIPGMEYTEWQVGAQSVGGMMDITGMPGMDSIPPHWLVYFAVADCDVMADKAAALGAAVYVKPTDIPGVGRFSVIADPQGAAFAIIRLNALAG